MFGPEVDTNPVIFYDITGESVRKASLKTKGAAGPSGMDADAWRRLMCNNKSYGAASDDLCETVARFARRLVSRTCDNLEAYNACRLVPLDKCPGLRPIGVGEVLRRIVGKSVMECTKDDISDATGNLQMCAGKEAGCEAAIHAMKHIFDEDDTEAVLLVDASNAFNSQNRKALLQNIKVVCPFLSKFASNNYQTSSRIFITGGKEVTSDEGVTQGDPAAMALYAIGNVLLQKDISYENTGSKHVAFADDINGGGKVDSLKVWWDEVENSGPKYGYFPEASKSWLIVKPELEEEAIETFRGTSVKISTNGHKHLGAAIGSEEFKVDYIQAKVKEWTDEITELSKIARTEPQAAFSAFVQGIKHKWTYAMRTVKDISHLFQPLEDAIHQKLIPSLTGQSCSDIDRKLLSLPPRLGGLGITNPVEVCEMEYENSQLLTSQLQHLIINQDVNGQVNTEQIKAQKATIKENRKVFL